MILIWWYYLDSKKLSKYQCDMFIMIIFRETLDDTSESTCGFRRSGWEPLQMKINSPNETRPSPWFLGYTWLVFGHKFWSGKIPHQEQKVKQKLGRPWKYKYWLNYWHTSIVVKVQAVLRLILSFFCNVCFSRPTSPP